MDLALFLLLNVVLMIRPEELIPEIAGARLYFIVIGVCLLVSGEKLLALLTPQNLIDRPITACVIGLLGAAALSLIGRGQIGELTEILPEFAKVILFFLLLVAVIDTPARLRLFMGWLVVCVLGISILALLQFHEVIDVAALRPLERHNDEYDPVTGKYTKFLQLRSTGIFNDPNDLCLILVVGIVCALYRTATARNWAMSVVWLSPLAAFGYALMLTKSRGGLLGLMAAIFALLYSRYGWKRTLVLMTMLLPVMAVVVGGRQTDISMDENDTAQTRIQLWSDGLSLLFSMSYGPQTLLTGIGINTYGDEFGHVAHNSFVHAYVELGLIGGGLFLGAFALAAAGLYRARTQSAPSLAPEIARMRPFLLAMVLGYAAGVFSLSRCYSIPTYLVLGSAGAYLTFLPLQAPVWFRMDGLMVRRLAVLTGMGLVFLKLFTQVMVRY
jgi:hypothetical protein